MSERLLSSYDGFREASEQKAGSHVTCRLADGNLERIRRFLEFTALRVKVRGDGPFGFVASFNSSLVDSTSD